MKKGLLVAVAMLLAGCQSTQQGSIVDRGSYQVETQHQAVGADQRVRFLVMHYTVEDLASSLKILTTDDVSAHYLLPTEPTLRDGKPVAFQLVPEEKRAWHAGVSRWRERSSLNDTSIGIENVNRGFVENGGVKQWQPYSAAQIDLLIRLSRDIVQRYAIQPRDVIGHSDIAPQRKQDPGPLFPWQQLAEAGIGAWPDQETVERYLASRNKASAVPMERMLEKLARYGYGIDPLWTAKQQQTLVAAFQMHFRPSDYRGIPDAESEAIVDALLSKYAP